MSALEQVTRRRDEILRIAARHGVGSVRVFGSFARDDAREDSDLDLLVEVTGPTTPWFPGGLVADLEALLGRRVDVVELEGLRGSLRERVLRDSRPL
jgi:hypothetical protein